MIFGLSTDDGTLHIFPNAAEAVAYAEGIDVENDGWLFFSDDGARLETRFTEPNQRGRFIVVSGRYTLTSMPEGNVDNLLNHLSRISTVEPLTPFNTVEAVRKHLTDRAAGRK